LAYIGLLGLNFAAIYGLLGWWTIGPAIVCGITSMILMADLAKAAKKGRKPLQAAVTMFMLLLSYVAAGVVSVAMAWGIWQAVLVAVLWLLWLSASHEQGYFSPQEDNA